MARRTPRKYYYRMGFAINGEPIPDPSEYSGIQSDLDTSAERDATGYLHRNRVATKYPVKIKWTNIDWDMMNRILSKTVSDKFEFTGPDPVFGHVVTKTCYAGDRDWSCKWAPNGIDGIGDLSFSVIEY